jgi:hypothetical protein
LKAIAAFQRQAIQLARPDGLKNRLSPRAAKAAEVCAGGEKLDPAIKMFKWVFVGNK